MRRQSGALLGWILMAAFAVNAPVTAQQQDRAIKVRPAEERKKEPDPALAPPLDRTPVLPAPDGLHGRGLASLEEISVTSIKLEGGTILSPAELTEIVRAYEGRKITIEELFDLRREISEAYVRHGFVNSGVVIPDQEVVNGVVVLKEVRGKLVRIDVSGNGRLRAGYIRKRIEAAAEEPLRVENLQRSLELLQQDPLIQQVNAQLVPSLHAGEAELKVAVKRTKPFQVAIGSDNQGSASTGGERGTLSMSCMNVTGLGDVFSSDVGLSGGRWMGSAVYSIPVNSRGTAIQASFALDHARIIEEPFKEIDIKSRTMRGGLSVLQPWLRDPSRSLVSTVGIEKKHSESTLLGFPFSFSPGDHDGKSDTTVINVGLEYTARTRNHVLAARGSLRRGLDLFNATINDQGTDGRFTAFMGQFQYAQRVPTLTSELLFRASAQIAADPLLAVEKMPIGGLNTVRAYRENQFVRDNGVAASMEWRVPVYPKGAGEGSFKPLNLRVAPFVDYGRAWDVEDRLLTSHASDIYSAGVGLLWNPIAGFRADVYWGHPFKKTVGRGNDLQDKGWHFTAHYRIPL
ncbi:MAG TPA: ShlB/FhaC/HecB family hemolysin secretion/activation protein [Acidobacteriota bacterium]|nr:ShlB/FhaC/HecB family hemolysin secretion/activation protein [Acidobacteriota bacterium]